MFKQITMWEKMMRFFLICIAAGMIISCKRQALPEMTATTSTPVIYFLSAGELKRAVTLSKSGDQKAFLRVYLYFTMSAVDFKSALSWADYSAAQHKSYALARGAGLLAVLGGKQNCAAAVRWYQRAIYAAADDLHVRKKVQEKYTELTEDFDGCVGRGNIETNGLEEAMHAGNLNWE